MTKPRFVTDENFNGLLLRALRRRDPEFDAIRVVDAGHGGLDDPGVLAWAAGLGRIVLSHDVRTMTGYAHDRIAAKRPMSGLILVDASHPTHVVIDDILGVAGASAADEYVNQIVHIPFDRTTRVSEPEPPEWAHTREAVTSPR